MRKYYTVKSVLETLVYAFIPGKTKAVPADGLSGLNDERFPLRFPLPDLSAD